MHIYLARHGEATQRGDDAVRVLTEEGRRTVHRVGLAFAQKNDLPTRIISSPLPRAVQTAELLAVALSYSAVVLTDTRLLGDTSLKVAVRLLRELGEDTLIVSHEPLLSSLAAYLLERPTFPAFDRSQLVGIKIPPGEWLWTIDPKLFNAPV